MNTKSMGLDLTGYYVSLLLSETPPPPAFVRLDLSTPETYRPAAGAQKTTKMDWTFFVRVAREIRQLGPDELVLSNLGDAASCSWLLDAVLFAKHFCRFPHVVLQTDVLSTPEQQLDDALQGGLDCLILNFNLSCRSWRERASAALEADRRIFLRTIEHALRVREEQSRTRHHRCLIYVSRLGSRQAGDERLEQAIGELAHVADHDYLEWLPEAQDLVGMPARDADCAVDRRCQCWTPFTEAHVTADGSLAACRHDYFGSSRVADLNTTSFEEAWHSPDFQQTRVALIRGELAGTLCASCPIRATYR